MRVMLADIEAGALNSAVTKLKSDGIDARGVQCDVADRASVQRAAAETIAAFEKVHVVCSNAGVGCGGPLELITPGDWDWVIGVNLMGFVHVIQAFLPHMRAQGEGGQIVTTASLAGMVCPPGTGPYNAAKFGNVAVAETLAAELAGTTIGVSVLLLGNVQTQIADSARNRSERYGASSETSPAATEQLAAYVSFRPRTRQCRREGNARDPGKRTLCLYASGIPELPGRALSANTSCLPSGLSPGQSAVLSRFLKCERSRRCQHSRAVKAQAI